MINHNNISIGFIHASFDQHPFNKMTQQMTQIKMTQQKSLSSFVHIKEIK